ncbi:MAG: peptide chain release factor N(5)-glutamine methyltransferase [Clostridia bacterium]|nr:peptide chain release factor N(5)-glutamine methyltransferase [Clostridia bacterium]
MAESIFEAYNKIKKELAAAGIEDCVFEAKQIIKHITGYSNAQILSHYNDKLTAFQQNNITAIIKQRLIRYPLQYIIGSWGFYGREFAVGPGVLIPRADTEFLIDACKELLVGKASPEIIDLCTGSGCVGITLGCEYPKANVMLVEKFPEATRYAYKNIIDNGAENVLLTEGDIFEGVCTDKKYDLIVSNPPYISDSEMETVSPEVKFEPETALKGGRDGLDFYRVILEKYTTCLNLGGGVAFEVGIGEAAAVAELMKNAGIENVKIKQDLNGIDRVVFGTLKSVQ